MKTYEEIVCRNCRGKRAFEYGSTCMDCKGSGKLYRLAHPELEAARQEVIKAGIALDTLKRPQNSHVCLTDLDRACQALRELEEQNG